MERHWCTCSPDCFPSVRWVLVFLQNKKLQLRWVPSNEVPLQNLSNAELIWWCIIHQPPANLQCPCFRHFSRVNKTMHLQHLVRPRKKSNMAVLFTYPWQRLFCCQITTMAKAEEPTVLFVRLYFSSFKLGAGFWASFCAQTFSCSVFFGAGQYFLQKATSGNHCFHFSATNQKEVKGHRGMPDTKGPEPPNSNKARAGEIQDLAWFDMGFSTVQW